MKKLGLIKENCSAKLWIIANKINTKLTLLRDEPLRLLLYAKSN